MAECRPFGELRRRWRWGELAALAVAIVQTALPVAILCAMPGYDLLVDDNGIYFLPLIDAGQERLWSGDLPFWKHTSLMGAPLFADGQPGVLYPPYWVAWWLTKLVGAPSQLIDVIAVLHAALGAAGAFLLARRFRARRGAAIALAVSWGLNGFFWVTVRGWVVLAATAAWLPLLVWAAVRCTAGRRWPGGRVATAALLWAAHGFAGYPQTSLLNAAAMGAVALIVGLRAMRSLGGANAVAWRVIRVVAAVAAGGAMVAPLWLPMEAMAGESIRAAGSLGESEVLGLSLPPMLLLGSWLPWLATETHFVMAYGYAGLVVGVFAIVGLIGGIRRRTTAWWAGTLGLVIAVPLAIGDYSPATEWVFSLPVISLFRWPFKNTYLVHFALLLLAIGGLRGVDDWLRRRGRDSLRRFVEVAAIAVALAGAVGVMVAQRNYAVWEPKVSDPGEIVAGLGGPGRVFLTTDTRLARDFIPPREAWQYAYPDSGDAPPSANGYSPLILRRYADLVGVNMFGFVRPSQRDTTLALVRQGEFFDMLGVEVLFSDRDDIPMNEALREGGYELIELNEKTAAWRNDDVLPRAFFVDRVVNLDDPAEVIGTVRASGAGLRTTAFTAVLGEPDAGRGGAVETWREVPDGYDLLVRTDGPAYLVVSATWDAGWRATSNGTPLIVDEVNGGLIGVQVEQSGPQQIRLRYRPARFDLGLLLAGIAFAYLIGGVVAERRKAAADKARAAASTLRFAPPADRDRP